jgi:NADH-quinone oxidoreductase subunit C
MAAAEDLKQLRDVFGARVLGTVEFRGEQTLRVELGALHDVLAKCRKDLGYEMIIDISSLDHFGDDPRFEMVYELATVDDSKHLRVKAMVGEDEGVPTATDIWPGADWHEREVHDMMGIPFDVGGLSVLPAAQGFPAGRQAYGNAGSASYRHRAA